MTVCMNIDWTVDLMDLMVLIDLNIPVVIL